MADMIVEFKIMPEDSDVDIKVLEEEVKKISLDYDSKLQVRKSGTVDMSFGIKAVVIEVRFDENLGSSNLEDNLNDCDKVSSIEVLKMDRL